MNGNKGEWSELYAFFKMAADGRLYAADMNAEKIDTVYYDILRIIRRETDDTWEYVRDGNIKVVSGSTGEEIVAVPISEFETNAEGLFERIKSVKASSFDMPELDGFLSKIKCHTLKADSASKTDITLVVHDYKTGMEPTLGFSIKSRVGGSATLLNPSAATNFLFKLTGHQLSVDELNYVNNDLRRFKARFEYLETLGTDIEFANPCSDIFAANLSLIDMQMPVMIAAMLEFYYKGKASTVKDLTELCKEKNVCNVPRYARETFYEYKVKELLTDIALGMMPATVWNGQYDATGGYIIVKEDGDVLCYHIYNRNEFREYLYANTKFDTPDREKHKNGKFETVDGRQCIKLGLQIRFIDKKKRKRAGED